MNEIIHVQRDLLEIGDVVALVLEELGFRCSRQDGRDEEGMDIVLEGRPAGANAREVYGRVHRVLKGYGQVVIDLAMLDMAGDDPYLSLFEECQIREAKEHAEAHSAGVPQQCVLSVADNARLPESLVRALYDFAMNGGSGGPAARVRGEMKWFLL